MPAKLGQKAAEETFVAFDFGTRSGRIAYARGSTPAIVADLSGETEIPAALTLSPEGGMLAGVEARNQQALFPSETVLSMRWLLTANLEELSARGPFFPHGLGDSAQLPQIEIGGRRRMPMELAALFLLHMRRTAEVALERPVESAVLTVPAAFAPLERQTMRLAALMAGLRRIRLIDESTAVALAGVASGVQGRMAVCCWGAGYASLAIVDGQRELVRVLGQTGSASVGGERLELALAQDALARLRAAGHAIENETHVARQLLGLAGGAIARIAADGEAAIELRMAEQKQPFRHTYRRDDLEPWLAPMRGAVEDHARMLAAGLGFLPGDVDGLILAGGMTRLPSVREALERLFGRPAVTTLDPMEAAVRGALLRAGFLNREIPQPLVLDSLPQSLGVEIQQGRVSTLLPGTERIPASKAELFTTYLEKQTEIGIPLHAQRNGRWEPFASAVISKIPPMKGSQPQIEVTFGIDEDGVLEVAAREVAKSRALEVELRPSRGLTSAQLKSVLQELPAPAGEAFLDRMREELRGRGRLLLQAVNLVMTQQPGMMTRDEKQLILGKSRELEEVLEGVDLGEMRTCSREFADAAQPLLQRLYDKSLEALLR
ncbi:MAG: Hsp70 family protein [Candidatus Eisenbacteria bacterium]|nr:Hsp70 family protein [Candidatus Eisenbacteria bacterium]